MSSVKIENSTLSLYIDDIRKKGKKIEIHKDKKRRSRLEGKMKGFALYATHDTIDEKPMKFVKYLCTYLHKKKRKKIHQKKKFQWLCFIYYRVL